MKAEDRIHLKSGSFDREAWAALWDRLPTDRLRQNTAEFVLHKLHAIESGGHWKMTWIYVTSTEREDAAELLPSSNDPPSPHVDQPDDVITFNGSLTIGHTSTQTDGQ
jgi:hypothetical protein